MSWNLSQLGELFRIPLDVLELFQEVFAAQLVALLAVDGSKLPSEVQFSQVITEDAPADRTILTPNINKHQNLRTHLWSFSNLTI